MRSLTPWRRLAPPLLTTLAHATHFNPAPPPRSASWEVLKAYASEPMGFSDDASLFSRAPSAQRFYDDYKAWCASRGLSTADDVKQSVEWVQPGSCSHRVCLEPNWAPYLLENDIEHWVLWHDPDAVPGDTELDPEAEKEVLKALLDEAFPDESCLVVFQNLPSRRSLQAIAHSHVFFRVMDEGTELACALSALRVRWEQRTRNRRKGIDHR